jgi:hypothetical protein
MRRTLYTLVALLFAFQGMSAWAKEVPISPHAWAYASRSSVQFEFCPYLGIPIEEVVYRAAIDAAAIWKRTGVPVRIVINRPYGACSSYKAFYNLINEIHFAGHEVNAPELAFYQSLREGGTLIEEDISIYLRGVGETAARYGLDPYDVLLSTLVHEFGHALGLDDAYELYPDDCGWSVMLAYCPEGPIIPTEADIRALRKIYGYFPSPIDSSPAPLPTPFSDLRGFDTNHNGFIDDLEFFAVIDLWISGHVSDEMFFQVIDAWISQTPVAGQRWQPSGFGLGQARVFDLSGRLVAQWINTSLRQALKIAHRAWPNGVYILVLRTNEGITLEKIAVLR